MQVVLVLEIIQGKTTDAEASRQFDLASLEFGGGYHCQYFKNKNEDREYRDFHSLKSGL